MSDDNFESVMSDCLKEILDTLRTTSTSESEVSDEISQDNIESILQRGLSRLGVGE